MSPGPSRAQARRKRALVTSLALVLLIAVASLGATLAADWHPLLGLDLNGGFSVVYKPKTHATSQQLAETVGLLTKRINGLGVAGGSVSTQGTKIVVSVPGVKNPQTILNKLGKTDQLYFRPALCRAYPYAKKSTPKSSTSSKPKTSHGTKAKSKGKSGKRTASTGSGTATTTTTAAPSTATTTTTAPASTATTTTTAPATTTTTLPKTLPTSCITSKTSLIATNLKGSVSSGNGVNYDTTPDTKQLATYKSTTPTTDTPHKTVLLPTLRGTTTVRYLLGPAEVNGTIVSSAHAEDLTAKGWVVDVTLTGKGKTEWNDMAKKYFHEIIGIELGGTVESAPLTLPTASSFTTFQNVEISGTFTQAQAQTLAEVLNYGSLPLRLQQLTTQTVSPTLGKSSLNAGLGAGIAGLILVLIYTVVYYRMLGAVVVSGLVVTAALLWSVISALGHTTLAPSFDLAGVTGIIVSIGITVDSYIVYFERLKDETRAGRTVRTSVDRGFRSAWRTVFAADAVSFLAAVILYFLAAGDVKGFAFFLGLSTILDLLMTYFFTRPLVILLGRNERLTQARTIGISSGLAVEGGEGL